MKNIIILHNFLLIDERLNKKNPIPTVCLMTRTPPSARNTLTVCKHSNILIREQ